MMHPGNPLSRSQLDEDVTDLAMYRYDAQGPSTFDGEDDVVIEHVVLNNGDALNNHLCWRTWTHSANHAKWEYICT